MTLIKQDSIRDSIIALAWKYNFEENHALFVESLALRIFDLLKDKFGLDEEDRLLMSHGAILHDVGNFINNRKHNTHSKYIIDNEEGLSFYDERKRHLLSIIVYNHRKKIHKDTMLLYNADQSIVFMLTAILRVADALDNSRENISVKNVQYGETAITIFIQGSPPEKITTKLSQKKELFKDIFKMDIVIDG